MIRTVASGLFAGPTPDSEMMSRLHRQGVRTLVSVDGARPDVELAAKQGLRYVHIPIGYDGVPRAASLALARVAREAKGGVYVHCHHGRLRGPAAAAILGRARGRLRSDAEVSAWLTTAGTDPRFKGLWRDALAFQPPPESVRLPVLVAVAEVDPFAAAMAAAGRAWAKLDQEAPDERGRAALLLREALRESTRSAEAQPSSSPDTRDGQFTAWLQEAEATAALLEAGDKERSRLARVSLHGQCQRCHERYRD